MGTTGTTHSDKVTVDRPTIGMSEELWPPLSICNTGKKKCQSTLLVCVSRNPKWHSFV